jgi:hypothetical protein
MADFVLDFDAMQVVGAVRPQKANYHLKPVAYRDPRTTARGVAGFVHTSLVGASCVRSSKAGVVREGHGAWMAPACSLLQVRGARHVRPGR